ncbi:hypothetical protein L7F22_027228 [Adiantum nelumboides]|nr:hypothetical protein [Adiantum nelumboides]
MLRLFHSANKKTLNQTTITKTTVKMINVKRVHTFLPRKFELFDTKVEVKDHQEIFYASIIHCDAIDEYAKKVAILTTTPFGQMKPIKIFYDCLRILPIDKDEGTKVSMDNAIFNKAVHYTFRILAFLSYTTSYESEQLPYLILPAKNNGKIDWEGVERAYELPSAVQLEDGIVNLEQIKDRAIFEGTQPWTDRPFIPIKIRTDTQAKQDIKTSKKETDIVNLCSKKFGKVDLTALNLEGPLLEMRNIPPAVNFLVEHNVKLHNYSTLPALCMLGALPGSMLCSARLLPSILTAYEQVLLVRQFQADVLSDLPIDEEKLTQALTLPNAVMGYDYQQLEFLGDCILKLIVSCIVFCSDGMAGEGTLTRKRMQTISNEHLTMISERLQIAQHVHGSEAIPKSWRAHGCWQRSVKMSDKMSADLVEAILGAAWSSNEDATIGLQIAMDCFNKLHLISQRVSLDDFRKRFDHVWPYKNEQVRSIDRPYIERMESTLGYKFKHPQLAIEAITHSSISSILKPSYERLEFLGDSVLEVCVVQLFHKLYPTLDEGGYSQLKSAAASNLSLGVACLKTDLSQLLMENCPAIQKSIEKFRAQVNFARIKAEQEGPKNQPFWNDLNCPKQLGDIVESILGAVFVDSGFDLEASRKVFNNLFQNHFLTYFNKE